MDVPVSQAKNCLSELLRRIEAGEEVILTRRGRAVARLEPVARPQTVEERRAILEVARHAGSTATRGPTAARSQDFLYDEDHLATSPPPGTRR